jgi:tripartite-type tricarboxylate transporter receptor subunit TctC
MKNPAETTFCMTLVRSLALLLACALTLPALAQPAYPSKPIRLIVPFPPGAGTDTVARLIAHRLGEAMSATIVIDNRTGAGGAIGAAEAAKADADGYTLLFVASPFTTVAASTKAPGYDPLKQFVAVAPIATGPLAFVVHPSVPAQTMREFIAYAKRHPGKINYGSAGPGSVNHLALELFMARTGTEIVHVPYRGIADATKDLLGGQLQAMTASIPATLPQLAEHRVRVLAVTGERRIPQLPGVPSWQEEGVADANVINYWGIVAPAGTPSAIVAKLNAEIRKLLAEPDVKARLEREGAEILSGEPQALGAVIERDLGSWRKLITEARLALQ